MYYLKSTDYVGIFELPSGIVPDYNTYSQQLELENIRRVLGIELGDLFYSDLDGMGNPVSARFISVDSMLRYVVLRLTYIDIMEVSRRVNSPIGVNAPIETKYPVHLMMRIHDDAADYANNVLFKYLLDNSTIYPEFKKYKINYSLL